MGRVATRTAACLLAGSMAGQLAGCTWLGPEMIRSGRPAFNDAVLLTNDQQLLQNVVRLRYGDSIGFMSVTAVTSHVSVSASAGVNVGAGSPAGYQGNLVPISGGVAAEQSPTVTYTPMGGDGLLRKFASDISVELGALAMNTAQSREGAWLAIVRRVNGLRNPDFVDERGQALDARFAEVASLAGELFRRGMLRWVKISGAGYEYALLLHNYPPDSRAEAARLLALLGRGEPPDDGRDVVVPVRPAVGMAEPGEIALETRSVLDLMRLAAASIQLPEDAEGALRAGQPGAAVRDLRIRASAEQPARAHVAVPHRGRWYYIADDDDASKRWFQLLQFLVGALVSEGVTGIQPVLTIPAGGRR